MLTVSAVLAPFILIGNLFVVMAVYKNYNLRTPTNFILSSLAVNDMVTSVAVALDSYPMAFGMYPWFPSTAQLLRIPLFMLSGSTMLHIVALTVDRYIAVTKPLQYPTLVTPKRVGYVVASIWTICLSDAAICSYIEVCGIPKAVGGARAQRPNLGFVIHTWLIVTFLITTLLLLVASNLLIMRIAVKQARAIENELRSGQNNRVEREEIRRRLKAAKTTGIIVAVLVFLWYPYILFFSLQVTSLADDDFMVYLNLVFLFEVAVAAALNPFIYHHRDKEFRQAFLKIFRDASNKFVR
nr:adenosine receptor A2a-like [Lytechinus pictus]